MENNYLMLIDEEVEKFCNQGAEKGYAIEYLEKANMLFAIYMQASALAEKENSTEELKILYQQAKKVIK